MKFSEQEGCISNSGGDTLTFNNHSSLGIIVQYAPGDAATLGSFLRALFTDNVTSRAPSVPTSTAQSYAGITSRRTTITITTVTTTTRTMTMMTTTCSLAPSTVQQNITPGALNPVNFPYLPGQSRNKDYSKINMYYTGYF